MSIYNFFYNLLDTSSREYALVTIVSNVGTVIALGLTIHSINDSRKQNKKISAKNSLDVIFKNIDESLNSLTFYHFSGLGGPESHFDRTAIYRLVAHPNIAGFCSNKHNYKVLKGYVRYLFTTLDLINGFTKELNNENLKKSYWDKLDVELDFMKCKSHDLI